MAPEASMQKDREDQIASSTEGLRAAARLLVRGARRAVARTAIPETAENGPDEGGAGNHGKRRQGASEPNND